MAKVLIAGASGFVGKQLIERILSTTDHQIIALSRGARENCERVEWRKGDLFSLLDTEKAVAGADYAIYLVHSMLPSAKLSQGSFMDFDLVIADNFARACRAQAVKQTIYMSGIIPEGQNLSRHLHSRLEVENTLQASGVPLTTLRAGLILGTEGSSYTILKRLVHRLPIMICPSWTRTLSNPIHITNVLDAIMYCLNRESCFDKIFDIGGPDILSYREMIEKYCEVIGQKCLIIPFPFLSPNLSKYWLRLITGAPKELAYPLISSLKSHMVPDRLRALPIANNFMSFPDAIRQIEQNKNEGTPHAFQRHIHTQQKTVRSIQRLPTLNRTPAPKIGELYFEWLPRFLRPLIRVEKEIDKHHLYFLFFSKPLLTLRYSASRSNQVRSLYYITGGILAKPVKRDRIEFRGVLNGRFTIVAIHDFQPTLPWFIYVLTQAKLHKFVMRCFGNYLLDRRL